MLSDRLIEICRKYPTNVDITEDDFTKCLNEIRRTCWKYLDEVRCHFKTDAELLRAIKQVDSIWRYAMKELEKEDRDFFIKDGFREIIKIDMPEAAKLLNW